MRVSLLLIVLSCFGLKAQPSAFGQSNEKKIYLDSLHQIVETSKDDSLRISALQRIDDLIYMEDPELDLELNHEILEIAKRNISGANSNLDQYYLERMAIALQNIGNYWYIKANFDKSLSYFNKSLKIAEKLELKSVLSNLYNNIGSIQHQFEQHDAAIRNFNEVIAINLDLGDTVSAALTRINLGLVLYDQEREDRDDDYFSAGDSAYAGALEQCSIAIEILSDFDGTIETKNFLITAMTLSSKIYLHRGAVVESFDLAEKALRLATELNVQSVIAQTQLELGSLYEAVEKWPEAISYSEQAFESFLELENLTGLYKASLQLYSSYKNVGDYRQALHYHERFQMYLDSINTESNRNASIEQQYKVDYEKQALRDSLNYQHKKYQDKAELERKDAAIEAEQVQKYSLLGFSALIGVLAVVLFRSYRTKKQDNKVISEQKAEVDKHRKKMLTSINYAERIQKSVLPELKEIHKTLPKFSVLYLPKDIVSGDFYWYAQIDNSSYVVLSDCTGHGVPGGFMSMLGTSLLKDIIVGSKVDDPHEILEQLDGKLRDMLKQYNSAASDDGMETAVLKINHQEDELVYAGANQNLFVLRDHIEIIGGSRRGIGGWIHRPDRIKPFVSKTIPTKGIKAVYMTSDGFEDQFGGESDTKFGRDRLLNLMCEQVHSENLNHFENALIDWKGEREQTDDICLVRVIF